MKLVVTSFVTLDGVMEGPGHDEHRDGRNAWALRVQGEDDFAYNMSLALGADAFLLGRKTFQIFAAFWPTSTGDDDLTRRMNEAPKYVVSNTLTKTDWANSTIISGDVVREIRKLKERPGGELLVYGSAGLVSTLLENDLIDEYRILVYPLILGTGRHLFPEGADIHHLRLVETRTFNSGVVLLTYVPEETTPTSRFDDEYSWTEEQVRSFQAAQDVDRVLATVVFTDLVDSTTLAASLGDRAWRQLIERHDEAARSVVDRWLGQFVKSTGDGILATFDTPTRALRCAFDLREALTGLDLTLRAAVHTGEIERRSDGDIGGIGVHIASRVLGAATADQVLVTRTVRDLATGTDLRFAPLGSVSLRGVPGEWDLYEASLS